MKLSDLIHRSEINSVCWVDTSMIRTDGMKEYRELPQYGNRHAIFNPNSEWGEVHYDEHNATNFPVGSIKHLGRYTNEKTGIPEDIATVGIAAVGLYGLYRLLKYLEEN